MQDVGQWGWGGKVSVRAQILKQGWGIRGVRSSKDRLPSKAPGGNVPPPPPPRVLWRCVSHASEFQRSKRTGKVTSALRWALAEFSSHSKVVCQPRDTGAGCPESEDTRVQVEVRRDAGGPPVLSRLLHIHTEDLKLEMILIGGPGLERAQGWAQQLCSPTLVPGCSSWSCQFAKHF